VSAVAIEVPANCAGEGSLCGARARSLAQARIHRARGDKTCHGRRSRPTVSGNAPISAKNLARSGLI
jgi:hypothetical protein